ncbi:MAG TPA: AMP-binding protein [Gemmataceae bacterium]|nr:AMP-binding protein [Gemmataceae bacterium]
MDEPLTEAERFPLLTERSRAMLRRLQQHAHAPRWTYACGERLDAAGLAEVQAYAARQKAEPRGWKPGEAPAWVPEFIERCRRDVPFYRDRLRCDPLPTCSREDLRREPWSFVPDSADISELVVYRTSGTTGNLIHLPAHPIAPARYLPLFQSALTAHGVSLLGGDRVSLIQVAAQVRTYTFASVSSYLDGAGHAKINLHPSDWNAADDPLRFFDDCAPEIVTSDPFALEQLATLPVRTRLKGILSSATMLLPALRDRLQRHFGCPVIDIYSMNETGPIAFARADNDADEHEILPHNLFVEILDESDRPVVPGQRGEIVVTGGVNPFLPLVRYRTGDFGALSFSPLPLREEPGVRAPVPRLVGIERRRPVLFHAVDGAPVVSISVTVALFNIPLPFFSLHQSRDGSLTFRTRCDAAVEYEVRQALTMLFGKTPLRIEQLSWEVAWSGKSIQYSREDA